MRRFTGGPLPHRQAVRAHLARAVAADSPHHGGLGRWALQRREDTAVVGEIGLVPLPGHDRVELGWHLARAWWGRGYATEAGAAAVGYGFDVVGLDEVAAVVDPANRRSRAVARRVGLAPAGRWHAYGRSVDAFALRAPPVDPRHVRLRPATADEVAGLRQRVLRPHQPPSALAADDPPGAVDVAAVTLAGRVVACARLSPEAAPWPAAAGATWRLRHMAVSAIARRLGVGRRLVDDVLARARAAGAAGVWCAARTPVQGFYARCGFHTVGRPWTDAVLGPHVGMVAWLR